MLLFPCAKSQEKMKIGRKKALLQTWVLWQENLSGQKSRFCQMILEKPFVRLGLQSIQKTLKSYNTHGFKKWIKTLKFSFLQYSMKEAEQVADGMATEREKWSPSPASCAVIVVHSWFSSKHIPAWGIFPGLHLGTTMPAKHHTELTVPFGMGMTKCHSCSSYYCFLKHWTKWSCSLTLDLPCLRKNLTPSFL